jgi:hypothetical protein
LDDQ